MSYRPASHPTPHSNSIRSMSIVSVSPSTSESSTLHDVTPSDATCYELPEDVANGTTKHESGSKAPKTVTFSAISLEIVRIEDGVTESRPRSRPDTSIYHSPPPPQRPSDMTLRTSRLAAKHLGLDHRTTEHAPKILAQRNRVTNGTHPPAKKKSRNNIPQEMKPLHLSSPSSSLPPPSVLDKSLPSSDLPKHPKPNDPLKPTNLKETVFRCSDVPPNPSASAGINDYVRTSLNIPFDFASYAKQREYIVRRVHLATSSPLSSSEASPPSCLDSETECTTLLEKSLSALFMMSKLRRLSPLPSISSDLFVIRCAPTYVPPSNQAGGNSSLGMFAQKEISTHQLILAERPCAILPFVIALDGSHEGAYSKVFQLLSPDLRNAVCELTGSSPSSRGSDGEECDRYEGIVQRNSLLIYLPVPSGPQIHAEPSGHRGLFLQASRINHRPNAVWSWNLPSFSLLIRAVRPITPDEEITIAYVPPELPYDARKKALWLSKGFECLCQSCLGQGGQGGVNQSSPQNLKLIQEGDLAREYLLRFRSSLIGPLSPLTCQNYANHSNHQLQHQQPLLDCLSVDSVINFKQWFKDKSIHKDVLVTAHNKALRIIESEGLQILDTDHSPHSSLGLNHALNSSRETLCAAAPSVSSSLPLSSSSKATSPPVISCQQRDVGYHIDTLVMCYGALGDTANFLECLTKAIKDRDERGSWVVESKSQLQLRRLAEDMGTKGSNGFNRTTVKKQEEDRVEQHGFGLRLAFSKWAANPTTFPLWGRRKSDAGVRASPGVQSDSNASAAASDNDAFELCGSLEEYALCCLIEDSKL